MGKLAFRDLGEFSYLFEHGFIAYLIGFALDLNFHSHDGTNEILFFFRICEILFARVSEASRVICRISFPFASNDFDSRHPNV